MKEGKKEGRRKNEKGVSQPGFEPGCFRPPHTNARGPEAVRGAGCPMEKNKIKRNRHLIQID